MTAPAGAGRARSSGLSAGAGGLVGTARRETAAAVRLLTRFPLPSDHAADTGAAAASGAIAFPLIGAVVGLTGAAPLVMLGWLQPLSSLLALAVIAVVTGALHLDGLADTADALLAPDRQRAERARKDPAVGPGGAVALILVVAIEASALASVATIAGAVTAAGALLIAVVTGRTVAVVTTALERSHAAADGFGAWFAVRVRPGVALGTAIIAGLIGAAIAVLLGNVGLAVGGVIGAAVGIGIGGLIVRWRGQLDGDALGAVVEVTVAAVLVAIAIVFTAPIG